MPYLAILLILLALMLLWQVRHKRQALGLPSGRIISSDTSKWGPVEQPLYDPELGLVGRPDYLVEQNGQLIPVEVKSHRIASAPYDAHIYQLAAYCLLVQRLHGKRPAYGILHYPTRTFAIDYTPALEAALLDLLENIRRQDRRKNVPRSHQSRSRCKRCGYRNICDQKLL